MSKKQMTMKVKMGERCYQGVKLGADVQEAFGLPARLEPKKVYVVPQGLGEFLTVEADFATSTRAGRTENKLPEAAKKAAKESEESEDPAKQDEESK